MQPESVDPFHDPNTDPQPCEVQEEQDENPDSIPSNPLDAPEKDDL